MCKIFFVYMLLIVYTFIALHKQKAPMYTTSAEESRNGTYNSLSPPISGKNNTISPPVDASTVLVPITSRVGGLMMHVNRQSLSSPIPPTTSGMYANANDGFTKTISGNIAITPRLLAPSPFSALPVIHQNTTSSTSPPYLSENTMLPVHQQQSQNHQHAHFGTLRRILPANLGVMGMGSIPSYVDNHSPSYMDMEGIPSASQVYYESTIPRNFVNRPTVLDPQQSSYGLYGRHSLQRKSVLPMAISVRSPAVNFNHLPTSATIGSTATICQFDNILAKPS